MQEITGELIDNFFKGLCSREEAASVLDFIKKHPDHPYLLKEWQSTDDKSPLPAHYTLEMYDAVVAHMGKEAVSKGQHSMLWRIAAAAGILSIFIALWLGSLKADKPGMLTPLPGERTIEWVQRQNTGDTAMHLLLPDGSKIILSPHASVRYRKDPGVDNRVSLYLQGQASFEVVKNKERPFTVYSGFISATALGTVFRVSNSDNGNSMKVRLDEGKVLVSVIDSVSEKMHKDYFLLPGEEIVFTSKMKPGVIRAVVNQSPPPQESTNSYIVEPAAQAPYKKSRKNQEPG